ncbi:hypothetical protein ACET3Z_028489 [Daucus carota]
MITGTLDNLYRRANELWAMVLGLQLAFKIDRNRLELETESREALMDWDDWRWTFGRVSELWHLDMGLGFIGGNFMVLDEDDYLQLQEE